MNIAYIPLYVSLVALAGSAFASWLSYRWQKSGAIKARADAADVITKAATSLLEPYTKENERLQNELTECQETLKECLEHEVK